MLRVTLPPEFKLEEEKKHYSIVASLLYGTEPSTFEVAFAIRIIDVLTLSGTEGGIFTILSTSNLQRMSLGHAINCLFKQQK